jgi:hypothetical protein
MSGVTILAFTNWPHWHLAFWARASCLALRNSFRCGQRFFIEQGYMEHGVVILPNSDGLFQLVKAKRPFKGVSSESLLIATETFVNISGSIIR